MTDAKDKRIKKLKKKRIWPSIVGLFVIASIFAIMLLALIGSNIEDVVKRNFDRVLSTVQEMARERVSLLEGKTMSALVEEMNEHDSSLVTGRLSNNIIVHFPGDESLVGSIVDVVLDECHGFYYVGHIAK